MNIAETEFSFPAVHAGNVFGQFDANMKKIEKALHVTLIFRGDKIKLIGSEDDCRRAKEVVEELLVLSERGNVISEQDVNYALSLSQSGEVAAGLTPLDFDKEKAEEEAKHEAEPDPFDDIFKIFNRER